MAHRADGLNDIFEHNVIVREDMNTKGGTVSETPTKDYDLVNKKYVDDNAGGLWEVDGTETQLITADAIDMQSEIIHNVPELRHSAAMYLRPSGDTDSGFTLTTAANNQTLSGSGGLTISSGSFIVFGQDITPSTDGTYDLGTHAIKWGEMHVETEVGIIKMYGNATAPAGYVNCDGASLLRAGTYEDLFAIIGVTYGTVDGTHFNVPDMRGAFPRGVGTSTQFTQDHTTTLGTYEDDSVGTHTHDIRYAGNYPLSRPEGSTVSYSSGAWAASGDGSYWKADTISVGRTSNETRPNNLGVNFIIKY